jgi:PAS domain S-box-containing protein
MEREETHLEKLFHEFQSSFKESAQEEKERLMAQTLLWVGEQQNQNETLKINGNQEVLSQEIEFLIENDIWLKQIVANMEQSFWLQDLESDRIIYISPAFEKIWGCSSSKFYTDPLFLIESVHPEDRVRVMAVISSALRKPANLVCRILRPDGSICWVLMRAFMLRDESGKPETLFCITENITDQKQVEESLQKTLDLSREQFHLSHKMSLGRKSLTVLKTLMSANEMRFANWASLLFFDDPDFGPAHGLELAVSWPPDQSHQSRLDENIWKEDAAFLKLMHPHRTIVINDVDQDSRLSTQVRNGLLEGQIHSLVIFPLITSGNWIGSLLVFFHQEQQLDYIHLRHLKVLVNQATITLYNLRLFETAEELRHEAERSNEIKTKFLAMISHELRTPLTSIIGFTTTLLAEDVVWEPDEQHDFIQTIHQEANRLQELIDQLLVLSRLEAGMFAISKEAHTLHEILNDVLPQIQIMTQQHLLSIDLPTSLPSVWVDPIRITQVLVNLVNNAVVYTPIETEIILTAREHAGFLQVSVIDKGPGIPPEERRTIFQAFRRGKNAESNAEKGAGLGLAICKGLVEAHGGRIWLEKKSTSGTTITFTIPIIRSDESENLPEEGE